MRDGSRKIKAGGVAIIQIQYITEEEIDKYESEGYEVRFMKYFNLDDKAFMAIKYEGENGGGGNEGI